jgi:hypothetical protein
MLTPLRTGTTGSRIPTGLLGLIAAVCCVEAVLGARANLFRDWMALTWAQAARSAQGEAAEARVLCLGDSLVKEGVLPRVLGRALGRPAYNLAVHGGSAPSNYFLLRRALRAGARPEAVVVDFHPNLLSSAPRSTGPLWGELLGPIEALNLSCQARDPPLFVRTVLAGLLPSYRLRDGLRDAVRAALRGDEPADRALCRALGRNLAVNLGARVAPEGPPPPDLEALLRNLPDLGPWTPHRANVAFLHRLFALADRAGVRVVWLWPPATAPWQARRVQIGGDARYEDLARAVLAAHPNVVVVDGRASGYDLSAFRDLTHLHAAGAAALSAGLAAVMGPLLDGDGNVDHGRWVALPPYQRTTPEPAVEDLDRSRLALGDLGAGRVR